MMDVDEKLVKFDELNEVEGKEAVHGEVGLERELEGYRNKCREMEERSKKGEEKCVVLELEIEKSRSEFELLESKFREFEVGKVSIEDEVKDLKRRNVELKEQINQFEKENSVVGEEVIELKIENSVLECEKKRAESEAEVWKLKCEELESRVLELEKENLVLRGGRCQLAGMPEMQTTKASNVKDGNLSEDLDTEDKMVKSSPVKGVGDLHAADTPVMDLQRKQFMQANGRKGGLVSETEKNRHRVRKQLEFGEFCEGRSLNMKMAPSTPAVARPSSFGIIDISDSENEVANKSVHTSCDNRMAHVCTDFSMGRKMGDGNKKTFDGNFKRALCYQSDEEDMNDFKGSFPFISTSKRKRASNIITTDSESDRDDDIPICKFKTKHLKKTNHDSVDSYLTTFPVDATLSERTFRESASPRRRRLVALRECNEKKEPEQRPHSNSNEGGANYHSWSPMNGPVESDEVEEDESESDTEGENLGGFIVNSSDISESDEGSNESEDLSDENVDFNEILYKIQRSKSLEVKWEFEADMLAAFGKDLELCMKAVCALYRKQTADEMIDKSTLYSNHQGFSQCDAHRGSNLAVFLTDGDPQGDVKRSVEELRLYDPKAPELCRTLATHYSKQLFAIYTSKEDPLYLPS